jgi:hypothetical protein
VFGTLPSFLIVAGFWRTADLRRLYAIALLVWFMAGFATGFVRRFFSCSFAVLALARRLIANAVDRPLHHSAQRNLRQRPVQRVRRSAF